jgi:hypothetical protein
VGVTGSLSCPNAQFCVSGVEPQGSAIRLSCYKAFIISLLGV